MSDQDRQEFEAKFSRPPYEFGMERFGDKSAWPGNYRDYHTQCAWEGYRAVRTPSQAPAPAEDWSTPLTPEREAYLSDKLLGAPGDAGVVEALLRRCKDAMDAWYLEIMLNQGMPLFKFHDLRRDLNAALSAAPHPAEEDGNAEWITWLAQCRDAFPMPEVGHPLEHAWLQAMAFPGDVPAYVRACVAAPTPPQPAAQPGENSK